MRLWVPQRISCSFEFACTKTNSSFVASGFSIGFQTVTAFHNHENPMGYGSAMIGANGAGRRPRIGYLGAFDRCGPPDPGGSLGLWTWEIARRMAESCDVLVCGPLVQDAPAREECEGVRFARFQLAADDRLFRIWHRVRRFRDPSRPWFASSLYRLIYAVRAAYDLRTDGCEVIQIFNHSQFVPTMRWANPRARIILNMQADWLVQLDRDLIDSHLRPADGIVGCSEYVTEGIRRRFPHYAERCRTVYNGVDTRAFIPRAERDEASSGERVIFVNRISPEKGLHVLLEAFERVVAQRPGATLEIVGPDAVLPAEALVSVSDTPAVRSLERFYQGSPYPELVRQRVRGVLDGRVIFRRPLPHHHVAERLREADVFVQPSVFDDPFPHATLEAMASGLPVVACAVGGIPEMVVDGQTGLLVERDDPGALADAILRLLGDPAKARAMGRAGRERIEEKFSWERILDALKSCYFEPLR